VEDLDYNFEVHDKLYIVEYSSMFTLYGMHIWWLPNWDTIQIQALSSRVLWISYTHRSKFTSTATN